MGHNRVICGQEDRDVRGRAMCDWLLRDPFLSGWRKLGGRGGEGFKHAVAVPAACGCSSDASQSVWQSSSCSFVYVCCRETKSVKREKGRVVKISERAKQATNFPYRHSTDSSMQTHEMAECSFDILSHPRFMLPFPVNHDLKH